MKIFVGNLARDVSDDELNELFSEYGSVSSLNIIRDMFSRESKGFGFVEMPKKIEAKKAMDNLNTLELKGKKLVVNEARPERNNRRGRGNSNKKKSGNSRRRY